MSADHPTVLTLPNTRLKDERAVIFLDVIRWVMSWRLRQNFAQIYVHGLPMAQQIAVDTGAVFTPNSVSQWDHNLFFEISELLSKHAFLFLPESDVNTRQFLRWCGIIPFNTDNSMLRASQLKQTHRLSQEPSQFWMFSQPRTMSTRRSTLQFQTCITTLSSHLEYPVIPVAIQYLYTTHRKPIAYLSFQDPLPHHCSTFDVEAAVKRGLDQIDNFHSGKNTSGFKGLYKRNLTEQQTLMSRLLSKLAAWRL